MKPERILLPLDVRRCPLEIFSLVEGFVRRAEVTCTLLHVIDLNIAAPDNRVYHEVAREARGYLERLAHKYVPPIASALLRVRFGEPAEQILEEARTGEAELIILPTYAPSLWDRLVSVWRPDVCRTASPLAEKIIREAACGVFVAGVKSRFDCEKAWGRLIRENSSAGDYSVGIPVLKPR